MDEGLDKEIYGKVKKMKVGKTSKMCTICCVAFQKGKILVLLRVFYGIRARYCGKVIIARGDNCFPDQNKNPNFILS